MYDFGFRIVPKELNVGEIAPFALGLAVIMLSWGRMILFDRKKLLRYKKAPFMRIENFLLLVFLFAVAFAVSASATLNLIKDIAAAEPEYNILTLSFKGILLIAGVLYFWMILVDILFIGPRGFASNFISFVKTYLGVFLLYQLIFALLSFGCNATVLFSNADEAQAKIAISGFLFFSNGAEGGFLSQAVSAVSVLTAASTYFVLSSLVFEHLKGEKAPSFKEQLKRMLFDSDTKILLVMLLLCLVSVWSVNSSNAKLATILLLASFLIWLFTMFSFLRHTHLLLFILNYTVMGLIELALPMPEITGVLSVVGCIFIFAVRLLFFVASAVLIGHLYYAQYVQSLNEDEKQTAMQRLTNAGYKITILQAGVIVAGAIIYRNDIAKAAKKSLLDYLKSKIKK